MSGFFHDLGSRAGRALRQGNWVLQSFTGTEEAALAAEMAAGQDLAAGVLAELETAADPEQSRWLDAIGVELTARVKDKRRQFRFHLVDSGDPNAFALPGGFIFVERSLLELCGWDRDEAAFVVGHEMAHVIKTHALERLISGKGLARIAGAIPLGGPAGMLLRHVGMSFLTSAYSREQEFDADDLGARLAAASGFARDGGPRLLGRLAKLHDDEPGFTLAAYFASHPPLIERIGQLQRRGGRA